MRSGLVLVPPRCCARWSSFRALAKSRLVWVLSHIEPWSIRQQHVLRAIRISDPVLKSMWRPDVVKLWTVAVHRDTGRSDVKSSDSRARSDLPPCGRSKAKLVMTCHLGFFIVRHFFLVKQRETTRNNVKQRIKFGHLVPSLQPFVNFNPIPYSHSTPPLFVHNLGSSSSVFNVNRGRD